MGFSFLDRARKARRADHDHLLSGARSDSTSWDGECSQIDSAVRLMRTPLSGLKRETTGPKITVVTKESNEDSTCNTSTSSSTQSDQNPTKMPTRSFDTVNAQNGSGILFPGTGFYDALNGLAFLTQPAVDNKGIVTGISTESSKKESQFSIFLYADELKNDLCLLAPSMGDISSMFQGGNISSTNKVSICKPKHSASSQAYSSVEIIADESVQGTSLGIESSTTEKKSSKISKKLLKLLSLPSKLLKRVITKNAEESEEAGLHSNVKIVIQDFAADTKELVASKPKDTHQLAQNDDTPDLEDNSPNVSFSQSRKTGDEISEESEDQLLKSLYSRLILTDQNARSFVLSSSNIGIDHSVDQLARVDSTKTSEASTSFLKNIVTTSLLKDPSRLSDGSDDTLVILQKFSHARSYRTFENNLEGLMIELRCDGEYGWQKEDQIYSPGLLEDSRSPSWRPSPVGAFDTDKFDLPISS